MRYLSIWLHNVALPSNTDHTYPFIWGILQQAYGCLSRLFPCSLKGSEENMLSWVRRPACKSWSRVNFCSILLGVRGLLRRGTNQSLTILTMRDARALFTLKEENIVNLCETPHGNEIIYGMIKGE